jgi:N-acetylated-alpha-linked acidic dipeptidase
MYAGAAKRKAQEAGLSGMDFSQLEAADLRFLAAAQRVHARQLAPAGDMTTLGKLNNALRLTESAFISEEGLPNRPWYRHIVFAPGEFTGYAAVVIPGVSEAIDNRDQQRAKAQLEVLTRAVDRAAATLNAVQ